MGRKLKNYTPFEDVRESHPWTRFPIFPNQAKNLIIGSFPPNKFTSHRERLTLCDMDFFYGSKENAFWELFINAKKLKFKLPDDIDSLKQWLIDNSWSVTDIVKSAQRKKDTAYDSDLVNIEWNTEAISDILKTNPILNIFFTSQWVKEKFDRCVSPHFEHTFYRSKNEFVLLSPSRNGLRKAKQANFTIHKALDEETAEQYRSRYYSLILNG